MNVFLTVPSTTELEYFATPLSTWGNKEGSVLPRFFQELDK